MSFLLLAALHTWPLVTALHEYSRDNDDERLNMWAVSWVAHQLPRDPAHLFDGNIFHPNRFTLAYSEPLILPGLMGAPIRWLGGSPILTYNVLVVSGLVLTAFAMYVLVTRWTRDHYAGLLAGALLAFSTQLLTRLPHLQILHLYWLPLAILALDRLVTDKRPRHYVWLGLCVLGAALTSGYLVMFVAVALGAAFVVRVDGWWGTEGFKTVAKLCVTAAVTLGVLVLVLWPYQALRRDEGLRRTLTLPRPRPWDACLRVTCRQPRACTTRPGVKSITNARRKRCFRPRSASAWGASPWCRVVGWRHRVCVG